MAVRTASYSTSASGAQNGYALGGAWLGDGGELIVSTVGSPDFRAGLVFTWGLSLDVLGRPLDPPVLLADMTLTLVTTPGMVADPGETTFELYVVPEAAPEDYGTLAPLDRDEILIAGVSAQLTEVPTSVVFELGVYEGDTALSEECADNLETMRTMLWSTSRWNGRAAFAVTIPTGSFDWRFCSSTTDGGTAPVLTSREESFHTGIEGDLDKGRNRICPRLGTPLYAQDAVRDGYRKGLMVDARAFDPEDRSQLDFHPPAREGVVDDELA